MALAVITIFLYFICGFLALLQRECMSLWTIDIAFFIRLHPIAPEPVLVRDLFLFFVHGIVFHIQFDIMFLAVTVIVIAAISGIGRRLSGKASIGSVISFHKRNVCIQVIGITGYIDWRM